MALKYYKINIIIVYSNNKAKLFPKNIAHVAGDYFSAQICGFGREYPTEQDLTDKLQALLLAELAASAGVTGHRQTWLCNRCRGTNVMQDKPFVAICCDEKHTFTSTVWYTVGFDVYLGLIYKLVRGIPIKIGSIVQIK